MQTFLPYDNYRESAMALDNKRLGKQRVETLQILNALAGHSKGWTNHPATRMWRGYESQLIIYGVTMCSAWIARGFQDTCFEKILGMTKEFKPNTNRPPWLGDQRLHISHQSNLVRKDPDFYGQKFDVDPDLPYYWPTNS